MAEIVQDFFSNLRHSIPPLSSLHDPTIARYFGSSNTQDQPVEGESAAGLAEARCLDLGNGKLGTSSQFQQSKLTALRVLRLHNDSLENLQHTTLQVRHVT